MSLYPTWRGFVSTLLVLSLTLTLTGAAWSQVQPAQILAIRAKIDDGPFTTPKAEDLPDLTVTVMKSPSGYLLEDKNKNPIRKFFDADGDNRVDTWCFYANGVEVYREQVTKAGYSFRWMGPGGMKWGIGNLDGAQKAKIDQWKMISAEEASQEAFLALAAGDFDRMKALFISADEMQALGLPATERLALAKLQQGAQAKFQGMRLKIKGLPQSKFSRLESAQPGCYLAENTGGTQDIVKANGLILFENPAGEKKHDYLFSHSLIQVGNAWRLTDVPSTEDAKPGQPKELEDALKLLAQVDATNPGQNSPKYGGYIAQRVQVLAKIIDLVGENEKENWTKQVFDNLASAMISGDANAAAALAKWKARVGAANPASCLLAYGVYRELLADYQVKAAEAKGTGFVKIQEEHMGNLEKFVQAFPTCDDVPDALIQLAMGNEFNGKDAQAKAFLTTLATKFPQTPNGQKAKGAIARLDSVGKDFDLAGPTINGGRYDIKNARGKLVVVYYWASFAGQTEGDFAALKKLQATHAKDVDIVCVCLDEKSADAAAMIAKAPTGTHLHDGGGMNGPYATQYGLFALPHAFLLDREGKVLNNKINPGMLDDEVSKLVKK